MLSTLQVCDPATLRARNAIKLKCSGYNHQSCAHRKHATLQHCKKNTFRMFLLLSMKLTASACYCNTASSVIELLQSMKLFTLQTHGTATLQV